MIAGWLNAIIPWAIRNKKLETCVTQSARFFSGTTMKQQNAKENILKKIRHALVVTTPLPFPGSEGNSSPYPAAPTDGLEALFAEQFSALQGRFLFSADHVELGEQLKQVMAVRKWKSVYAVDPTILALTQKLGIETTQENLAHCDVSITDCAYLVARTGSMVLSSASTEGRTASVYAPVHICIAHTSQLVYDVQDALVGLKENFGAELPSFITFATGPSRTADIEKTLVVGIHGPAEVFVFLTDEPIR
jgi:L-lactate dehydrogenase complex protein LldG